MTTGETRSLYAEARRVRYDFERRPDSDLIVTRVADAVAGPLPHIVLHSPTGFELGYRGSGPTDLALALIADATGATTEVEAYRGFHPPDPAVRRVLSLHMDFRDQVIAGIEIERGWKEVLYRSDVRFWIAKAECRKLARVLTGLGGDGLTLRDARDLLDPIGWAEDAEPEVAFHATVVARGTLLSEIRRSIDSRRQPWSSDEYQHVDRLHHMGACDLHLETHRIEVLELEP